MQLVHYQPLTTSCKANEGIITVNSINPALQSSLSINLKFRLQIRAMNQLTRSMLFFQSLNPSLHYEDTHMTKCQPHTALIAAAAKKPDRPQRLTFTSLFN